MKIRSYVLAREIVGDEILTAEMTEHPEGAWYSSDDIDPEIARLTARLEEAEEKNRRLSTRVAMCADQFKYFRDMTWPADVDVYTWRTFNDDIWKMCVFDGPEPVAEALKEPVEEGGVCPACKGNPSYSDAESAMHKYCFDCNGTGRLSQEEEKI